MNADVAEMEALIAELLELERLRDGRALAPRRARHRPDPEEAAAAPFEDAPPGVLVELPAGELSARIDPEKIRTVLRNLLENAAKYALPDSAPVVLSAAREAGGIVVRVRDDGPGIPEADRRHPLRAVLPRRPLALEEDRRLRPRPQRSARGSSRRTAAPSPSSRARGAGRRSSSGCPPRAERRPATRQAGRRPRFVAREDHRAAASPAGKEPRFGFRPGDGRAGPVAEPSSATSTTRGLDLERPRRRDEQVADAGEEVALDGVPVLRPLAGQRRLAVRVVEEGQRAEQERIVHGRPVDLPHRGEALRDAEGVALRRT